jgi:uncharacterized protein YjbJ (UPF0337 family)
MNSKFVRGNLLMFVGRIQETWGRLTGRRGLFLEGRRKQHVGWVLRNYDADRKF